ncbi:MAG: glutamine--fructose-6-phosphate transaminase (isomerizing) [Myxococcota bacterium]
MCGIVGYIGVADRGQDVVLDGLRRLEYRGYDSAGIAVLEEGKIRVVRSVGKLIHLESALRDAPLHGRLAIGHTRWATHGRPSEANAHPHRVGSVALIHNGIVENHRELRAELRASGARFRSDTDSEIIAHLVQEERRAGRPLLEAVQAAVARLAGSYAVVVIDEEEPDRIVAAKSGGSPCIVSAGEGEGFVASDIPAILPYTREIIPLEDGDVALVQVGRVEIHGPDGTLRERSPRRIAWDPVQAEKGGYDRFMHKEICEQPRAISDTIGTRALEEEGDIDLDGIEWDRDWVRDLAGVHLVAMGTARHACMVGAEMIERLARIPASVDLASEYRYRDPVVGPQHLVLPVSQSGETTDTLLALREAAEKGARSLAVCNVHASTIARDADDVLYTHAGLEIGVASTKCFTAQLAALYLVALRLGQLRGTIDRDFVRAAVAELRRIPAKVERALGRWNEIEVIAQHFYTASNFLFLGRGVGYPVALEGALKLKEISYIHAEGYAAGEMKHGPIALIDEGMPVVVIANRSATYRKVLSNAAEVRARQGTVIAIADEGDSEIGALVDEVIAVPPTPDPLSAIVSTVPLQIFAYQVATLKGTDVDQPRNLAKSVTVE